jgi:hypothetical protein
MAKRTFVAQGDSPKKQGAGSASQDKEGRTEEGMKTVAVINTFVGAQFIAPAVASKA